MLWLSSCPRCGGDIHLERNEFEESELYCLQCGFRRFGWVGDPTVSLKDAPSHWVTLDESVPAGDQVEPVEVAL